MTLPLRVSVAASAVAVLLLPAAAPAATKTVTAGPHREVKSAPAGADVNAFFPAKVKVAVGDRVRFEFHGFHNVDFRRNVPFVIADASKPISGINDAAGQPFWFNGQPRPVVNPAVAGPTGDGAVGKGKSDDSSGIPAGEGPPKPYLVRFTKTGTFTYYCDVHPGMKGKVTVQRKGRRVPSRRSDAAAADRQLAKALKTLRKNDRFKGPGGSAMRVGNDTKDTAFFRFFPGSLTVKAGVPVKFQMSARTGEVHNVAVAPEAYVKEQAEGLIVPDASAGGPPVLALNPIAFLPSDPPTAFPAHSPSLHGNGFINTGVLDTLGASPFPREAAIAFGQPGTYTIYCIIHAPDMKATVTVTP